MKAIRYISFFVLASIYLAVACATTLSLVVPLYSGKGPAEFVARTCHTKDSPPQKTFVQRRHIPLVKQLTIPVETACPVEFPNDNQEPSFVHQYTHSVSSLTYYSSSLRDRAPPVA